MSVKLQNQIENSNEHLFALLKTVRYKRRDLRVRRILCTVDGIIMTVNDVDLGRPAIVRVSASDANGILKDFVKDKPELKGIEDKNKYYIWFWEYATDFEKEELQEEILDVIVFRIKNPIIEQIGFRAAFA